MIRLKTLQPICLIFFLFISCFCLCQNTFFNVYNTNKEERVFEVAQTTEGNYILVGKRATHSNESDVKGLMMLVDNNGAVLKEFVDDNMGKTYFYTIDKIPGNENMFLVIGSKDTLIENTWQTCLMHYTIDNQLIVNSRYFTHKQSDYIISPWKTDFVNDTTMMLLSGRFDLSFTFPPLQIIVTEISLPADSIRSYISDIDIICIPQDILHIPNNNETHIFYFGSHLYDRSHIKILRLDQMLNVITSLETPTDMVSTACATLLNDSSYLLTGTAHPVSGLTTTRDIAVFRMDEHGNGMNGIQYNNHQDTITYGGAGTNTTIVGDTIYVVGVHNLDPFAVPWQSEPSWIQITTLDMELNILGHHFYGGDAFYMPYCIIPTNDNGLFITGYVWDYKSGIQQHDIFALKLNSDGLIVDVPEHAPWQATEAIHYPNPANERINIEFSQVYQTATFQLMDMGGKTVLEKLLDSNYQSINISTIPAGTYVYRIFNKEGLDERGKVVAK